jgi:hypothetical protein
MTLPQTRFSTAVTLGICRARHHFGNSSAVVPAAVDASQMLRLLRSQVPPLNMRAANIKDWVVLYQPKEPNSYRRVGTLMSPSSGLGCRGL